MKNLLIALSTVVLLTACAKPESREHIKATHYDCNDVDEKISALEAEKEANNHRIKSGVQSIIPVAAIVNIARHNYRENVAIATGEWAEVLDNKVAEMQTFKRTNCS